MPGVSRAVVLRAVNLRAVILRAAVLRAAVLRAAVLRDVNPRAVFVQLVVTFRSNGRTNDVSIALQRLPVLW